MGRGGCDAGSELDIPFPRPWPRSFPASPGLALDEKKLTYAGGEIYEILCSSDQGYSTTFSSTVRTRTVGIANDRIGRSNNHFKIACTGQASLNTMRSFNAGRSEAYPDAVSERCSPT